MNVKVVDASAIAAVPFGEPEATTMVGQLASGRLVAPAQLHYEVASIAWKKIKRNQAQRDEFMAASLLLGRMAVGCRHADTKSKRRVGTPPAARPHIPPG
jgi:predicted nucleic acid-binding protein